MPQFLQKYGVYRRFLLYVLYVELNSWGKMDTKLENRKKTREKPVSLFPLNLEEALHALLATSPLYGKAKTKKRKRPKKAETKKN